MKSVILVSLCAAVLGDPLLRVTQTGPVRGIQYSNVYAWMGIPYAAAPVGPLRWAPPRPRSNWSSVLNAVVFGPACPQDCHTPPHTCPDTYSEDCLSLNVWSPANSSSTSLRPVQFWIHGGQFTQGAGGSMLYNATNMVQVTDHVIVTINYRLGALGFLQYTTGGLLGNYGFMDQQLALQWVAANIRTFGGDPNNVILFGQSAGGTSASVHLMVESSWPYFQSVVMESAPFGLALKDDDHNFGIDKHFIQNLGCDDATDVVACLRAAQVDRVVVAAEDAQSSINLLQLMNIFYPWTPVVDGSLVKEQPLLAFMNGRVRPDTPLIAGTTVNETVMFIFRAFQQEINEAELLAGVTAIFGPIMAYEVMETYPAHMYDDLRLTLSYISTHYIMECPNRAALRGYAAAQAKSKSTRATSVSSSQPPVWGYIYDHVQSFSPQMWGPNFTYCIPYVCHAEELLNVWDTGALGGFEYTNAETNLAHQLMNDFASLATSGPSWPRFGATAPSLYYRYATTTDYDHPPGMLPSDYDADYCDFWDNIGYLRGYGNGNLSTRAK